MRRRLSLCLALALAAAVPATLGWRAMQQGTAAVPDPGIAAVTAGSRDLGPARAGEVIPVNLGLAGRDPDGLDAAIAHGVRLSSAAYADRFGPDPAAVAALSAHLRGDGLSVNWRPGSPILAVDGTPATMGRLFGVGFHDYVAPDGHAFYAATGTGQRPSWMQGIVTNIFGLDDFARVRAHALHPGDTTGFTPTDAAVFYNFKPLHDAGLSGKGVTVLFPDSAPGPQDLQAYTAKFHLPPMDVTVKGDSTPPSPDNLGYQEVVQDLDIVHAIAPDAKLVVYNSVSADGANTDAEIAQYFVRLNDQMVSENLGQVISESMGWCGAAFDSSDAEQLDAVFKRAASQGISAMVSSGDEGGYGCVRDDGDQHRVSVELPASDPWVTAVGGTTVFLGQGSTYYKEMAWGNAVSWNGTGGGNSAVFARPDWQKGPGVDNSASNGKRQVPDVAGLADENTGWDISVGAQSGTDTSAFCACGDGTSASAPLWAGLVALLDQDLIAHGGHTAGFANPAIYSIGARNDSLAGPPFHDVTEGDNLVYVATPGWDYATGWGTPNAAALVSAWEDYLQGGGS